jgi:ubiquinone/menaquinone biosynthesis C-methylase UbiE
MAIKRLLGKTKFSRAADIGGGYGRLTQVIAKFARKVYLVEPSAKMRGAAKDFLKKTKNVEIVSGSAEKTHLHDNSLDLLTTVRVIHHISSLDSTFQEIHRVVKTQGAVIIEFANSLNFKARIQSFVSGKPILMTPVDRRSPDHIKQKTIEFVNHHPEAIYRQLRNSHFKIDRILSVSNFRSPLIKKTIPLKLLLVLEYFGQAILSGLYFGPSIFVLAHRIDKK